MTDLHERARYYATKYGVDPDLFERLVQQESSFDPNAVSPTGARGLTQVLPSTARDPGYGVTPLTNPDDPEEQLRMGAEYYAAMLKRYNGDNRRALASYNGGQRVADRWSGGDDMSGLSTETQGYVRNIMGSGSMGSGVGATATGHIGLQPTAPQAGIDAPYEPDAIDKLYGKVQGTGLGKSLGLREGGFHKGSMGRTVLGGVLSGIGGMV